MSKAVEVTWLGQAGFALRAPGGELCLVDPYLSDYLREMQQLPRIAPIVMDPSGVRADVAVATHWHPDHLDPATSRDLHRSNPSIMFVGPPANASRLMFVGVEPKCIVSLGRGEATTVGPFVIRGFFARHEVPGWICEDALTVVIEVAGVRIFHTGDTEYDARIRTALEAGQIDVGLFSMNGTGGNMNALEAATLACQLHPRLAVPMHYGMWADEAYGGIWAPQGFQPTLDPRLFVDAYERIGGGASRILEIGETITLPAQ